MTIDDDERQAEWNNILDVWLQGVLPTLAEQAARLQVTSGRGVLMVTVDADEMKQMIDGILHKLDVRWYGPSDVVQAFRQPGDSVQNG